MAHYSDLVQKHPALIPVMAVIAQNSLGPARRIIQTGYGVYRSATFNSPMTERKGTLQKHCHGAATAAGYLDRC